MPFIQEPGKARPAGAPFTPPVTTVRPPPKLDAPAPTHRYVMVRHSKGHRFMSAAGPDAFYGPGRHYVPLDVAREIESAESRVAAEEYSFRDPTPRARILNGYGQAYRVSPDELDSYIGTR